MNCLQYLMLVLLAVGVLTDPLPTTKEVDGKTVEIVSVGVTVQLKPKPKPKGKEPEKEASSQPPPETSWTTKAAQVVTGLFTRGKDEASGEVSTDVKTQEVVLTGPFKYSVMLEEGQPSRRVYKIDTTTQFRKWLQEVEKDFSLQSLKYSSVNYRVQDGNPHLLEPCVWFKQNVYLYVIGSAPKRPKELASYTKINDEGEDGTSYYVVDDPATKLNGFYETLTDYGNNLTKISISTDETVTVVGEDGKEEQKQLPLGYMVGPYVVACFEPKNDAE